MYTCNMEKIKEVELRTTNYSFTVEVVEDVDRREFVGKINGFTPPLAQEVAPGGSVVYMKSINEEEMRDTHQENLVERCRARIKEIDGEILTEREI
jgi:hypothetical protein